MPILQVFICVHGINKSSSYKVYDYTGYLHNKHTKLYQTILRYQVTASIGCLGAPVAPEDPDSEKV